MGRVKTGKDQICLICKINFYVPRCWKAKYCSKNCYVKSQLGKSPWNKGLKGWRLGEKHPWKIGQIPKSAFKIGQTKGKNHPCWKGGKYTEDYRERRYFRITMQKLIFERDNYKCQICESGGNLQVDHIASWAEFKELRFDPDNCRTLCAKCHYKLTFGRKMPKNVKAWGHNLLRRQIL